MDVVDINDHRPHLSVTVENGDIHTMPVATIESIISQKLDITEVDDYKDILSAILKEWLADLQNKQD